MAETLLALLVAPPETSLSDPGLSKRRRVRHRIGREPLISCLRLFSLKQLLFGSTEYSHHVARVREYLQEPPAAALHVGTPPNEFLPLLRSGMKNSQVGYLLPIFGIRFRGLFGWAHDNTNRTPVVVCLGHGRHGAEVVRP